MEQAGSGGKLDDWLRDHFFEQHCKLFHRCPFVWQIWDGRKDGFSALINYHKLDNSLLKNLIYGYLDEWIRVQKRDADLDVRVLIFAWGRPTPSRTVGKNPEGWHHSIFLYAGSRWKQPIGWHPDLNDGVRLNIRPLHDPRTLRRQSRSRRPSLETQRSLEKRPRKRRRLRPGTSNGLEYEGKEGDRINDHHSLWRKTKVPETHEVPQRSHRKTD